MQSWLNLSLTGNTWSEDEEILDRVVALTRGLKSLRSSPMICTLDTKMNALILFLNILVLAKCILLLCLLFHLQFMYYNNYLMFFLSL